KTVYTFECASVVPQFDGLYRLQQHSGAALRTSEISQRSCRRVRCRTKFQFTLPMPTEMKHTLPMPTEMKHTLPMPTEMTHTLPMPTEMKHTLPMPTRNEA